MKLETLEKANYLKEKIDREISILDKLQKLSKANEDKKLSSKDIQYILERAYEGSKYIRQDLLNKFNEL